MLHQRCTRRSCPHQKIKKGPETAYFKAFFGRGDCPECEPNAGMATRFVEEFIRPPELNIRMAADFYRESA